MGESDNKLIYEIYCKITSSLQQSVPGIPEILKNLDE